MDSTTRPRCSAILLNWRRAHNVPRIIESLRQHDCVDDVVIWNNAAQDGSVIENEFGTTVNSPSNQYTYGRFLALAHCRHSLIYTQDDDVISDDLPCIYEEALRNPECITAGLPSDRSSCHWDMEAGKRPWIVLGFGAFFRREWAGVLDLWRQEHGEDELLRRKADWIFSVLWKRHRPIKCRVTRLTNPDGTESGRDENAVWKQPDHRKLKREAVRKALALRDGDWRKTWRELS